MGLRGVMSPRAREGCSEVSLRWLVLGGSVLEEISDVPSRED